MIRKLLLLFLLINSIALIVNGTKIQYSFGLLFNARILTEEEKNVAEREFSSIMHKCSDRLHVRLDSGHVCDAFMNYFIQQCENLDNLISYCDMSDKKTDLDKIIQDYRRSTGTYRYSILDNWNLLEFYKLYRGIQLGCLSHDKITSDNLVCEEFIITLGSISSGYKRIENSSPHVQVKSSIPNASIYFSDNPIMGETINNYTYPIKSVQLLATIFDDGGNVISTKHVFVQDDYLNPGQPSGFLIPYGFSHFPLTKNGNYALTSIFKKAETKPGVLRLDVNSTSLNPVQVAGSVTNLGNESTSDVKVTGIFYDAKQNVIAIGEALANNGTSLLPGEKSAFNLYAEPIIEVESRDKIKSYTLSVQSPAYSMLPVVKTPPQKG